MKQRGLHVISFLFLFAGPAGAQIIRPQLRSSPAAFASLGIGWLNQQGFCDKTSGDCWDFGSAPQWRAAFELPLSYNGASWGLVGTTARVPLVYQGSGLLNSCSACDANANVSQVMALFRLGGMQGFHQVIDVAAGAALFSNFRATDGTKLGTGKTTSRFTASLAYGFGYGFSNRSEVFLEQEYGLIMLPRMAGTTNNTAQQSTLRIGGRIGIGDKRY